MRLLGDITKPKEIFEGRPCVSRISKPVGWKRNGPSVAKAFAIEVQVRRRNLLIVRIAVRRAAQIEAHQYHDLTPPVLHLDLMQVNATAAQVEQEIFASV